MTPEQKSPEEQTVADQQRAVAASFHYSDHFHGEECVSEAVGPGVFITSRIAAMLSHLKSQEHPSLQLKASMTYDGGRCQGVRGQVEIQCTWAMLRELRDWLTTEIDTRALEVQSDGH